VLPILHQLLQPQARKNTDHKGPSTLVLVPTRELAQQVHAVFQRFIQHLPDRIKSLPIFGGVAINPQMQALRHVDILIATPGRLIDLEQKNAVKLAATSHLILDEADKMLNLGFKEEVNTILKLLPNKRQNLLFSATLSDDISALNLSKITSTSSINGHTSLKIRKKDHFSAILSVLKIFSKLSFSPPQPIKQTTSLISFGGIKFKPALSTAS